MASNPVKQSDSIFSVLMPHESVSMEAAAFDVFVNNYGIRLIHLRALPCPIGLQSSNDIRRTHDDHSGCSNGFIYQPIGRVTAFFLSNQTQVRKLDMGFIDGSTVSVTFPRFYDSEPDHRILVRPYDRFYLEEESVTTAATNLMSRRTDALPDKPAYPALRVHQLIDSTGKRYAQGVDFIVQGGDIVWANGLGPNPGQVYSIWYEYQPYWYCERLIHEIRIIPTKDYVTGSFLRNERLSFAAILNREYIHRDSRNDLSSPDIGGRQGQVSAPIAAEPGIVPNFGPNSSITTTE